MIERDGERERKKRAVVRVCKTKQPAWNGRRDHWDIIARRLGLDRATGCYDSRGAGEYTTVTIFLRRTMERFERISTMCFSSPFCLFRHCKCSKNTQFCILPIKPRDAGAPSLHYLRHLLTIHQAPSRSLSVTFALFAPSQHPIEQAELTAFALRCVAIAHKWTCSNFARRDLRRSVQGFAQNNRLARRDRSTQLRQVLH